MEFYWKVEQATVRIQQSLPSCNFDFPTHHHSQGVVVNGGYIITAAHCLDPDWVWQAGGGNYYPVSIKNQSGTKSCVLTPVIVERMLDIAVLGCPDDEKIHIEYQQYEALIREVQPLQICTGSQLSNISEVYTFSNRDDWVKGRIINDITNPLTNTHQLWVKYESTIYPGTSGGPIVNNDGELIAVVSEGFMDELHNPLIYECLPKWIMDEINN